MMLFPRAHDAFLPAFNQLQELPSHRPAKQAEIMARHGPDPPTFDS